VFQSDEILLVKERRDGLWTLPGGFADVNDAPSEAIEREIREESGYEARAVKLAMVYDKRRHDHPPSPRHTYKLFFLCELTADAPSGQPDNEVDDVQFFARDSLPEQLSTGRTTRSQLEAAFAHHDDPSLPTEFD
jgi:ADP-ribose pyrophosphatase YjhB (NUDIX family)